jgi:hypothetical protein
MTESAEEPGDPDWAELARNAREAMFPFDPALETLVMYINLLDKAEVGITLHVKGAVPFGSAYLRQKLLEPSREGSGGAR